MAPPNRVNNPFESSFENLSSSVQSGAKKVQKAAGDTVKAVIVDAKQQIMPEKTLVEQTGVKALPRRDQQQIQSETAQNLAKINDEINRIRQERIKKDQERKRAQEQEKQQKKMEEKKKKEDPVWLKALKGQTGSQEGPKNVAG